ncbi:hypothetical protein ACIF8R_08665 [Acinetobacter sp. ABJ_C4_1]|uniref:hypothetical protein n=1 Tax=Acinetobacter sp. ABJ_C4_1 TaxID=3377080 RepID=UPI0037CC73B5
MRRILIAIAGLVVIAGIVFFSYQHIKQQQAKDSSEMFDVVMNEKMSELYEQAQDWSKPVQLDIHDKRLGGHYKQVSEFLLSYWVQNVNARNEYLRELKAAKWDTFLNVDRLDLDKKQKYAETEKMLADVRQASDKYQSEYESIHKTFLAKIQELSVDADTRQLLEMKLGTQQKADQDHTIFMIELQILDDAEEMFKLLKNYSWQKKDHMILFHENAQVKKFNELYQHVLKLNAKIESIKKKNVAALENELEE